VFSGFPAPLDAAPIFDLQVLDDARTPGTPADDIVPVFAGSDDGGDVLEAGEVWLYAAPAGLAAQAGAQRHLPTPPSRPRRPGQGWTQPPRRRRVRLPRRP
jgi:hypothetical protein